MNTTKKRSFIYDETDTYDSHFFFIVTALIIGAFWGGFYFGGSLSGNADSGIQIASVEDQAQEAANENADGKKENTVAKQETVESMKTLSEENIT